MDTAIEPHVTGQTKPTLWQRLGPALSAAVCISWVLILQEIMSDLIPFFGSLFTLPIWIFLYYIQGLLTGYFAKRDPNTQNLSIFRKIGMGLISAVWSGVVFSAILAILGLGVSSVLTAGAAIVTLPLTIAGSALDIFLNLFFCGLGVWIYSNRNGKHLIGPSCAIMAMISVGYCLVLTTGAILLATGGYHSLEPIFRNWSGFQNLPIPNLHLW
jgi:hypothetical protein